VATLDAGMKALVDDLVGYTQKFTMVSQKKSQVTAAKQVGSSHKGRPSKHGKLTNSHQSKHTGAARMSVTLSNH
jgi:hypothetical protein